MNRVFATPHLRLFRAMGLALCLAFTLLGARAAPWLDETPRMAVMSAFEPEWKLLLAQAGQAPDFATLEASLRDTLADVTGLFDKLVV